MSVTQTVRQRFAWAFGEFIRDEGRDADVAAVEAFDYAIREAGGDGRALHAGVLALELAVGDAPTSDGESDLRRALDLMRGLATRAQRVGVDSGLVVLVAPGGEQTVATEDGGPLLPIPACDVPALTAVMRKLAENADPAPEQRGDGDGVPS